MNEEMMRHVDLIGLHSKAIKILHDPSLTLLESTSMIKEMFRQYEEDSKDYYGESLDECCVNMAKSDLEELLEDDNRERARDMIAATREVNF